MEETGHSDHGQDGSDADTDDLLTSADLLCSGASDKKRDQFKPPISNQTPKKSDESTSKSPSAAKRSLNFDPDKISTKQTLWDKAVLSNSQSCPSTPQQHQTKLKKTTPISKPMIIKSDDQMNVDQGGRMLVPFSIPSHAFAILRLSNDETDIVDNSTIEQRVDSLRSLLTNAKSDLHNANQLINKALTFNLCNGRSNDSGSSMAISLSPEERSFVEKLNPIDVRELYEAEYCKRRYCDKKIEILQKQLLDMEQKLAVATVAVDKYKNVISDVEDSCNDLVMDITTKDRERTRREFNLTSNNGQLKMALERVMAYGHSLGGNLDACNEKIQTLEIQLDTKSSTISALESENCKLKEETNVYRSDIDALKKKLDQSQTKMRTAFEREEQLTKRLLVLEKSVHDNDDVIQRLKSELGNEKSSRRHQLDERERIYKDRTTELAKDFDSRMEKTRQESEQRKANEMKKLKDEWDGVLHGLSEKYAKVVNERDEALKRLKEYEETFLERQRVMCYELQQRLSSKYYELLSEFGPGFPSSNNGNANYSPAGHGDFDMGNNPMVGSTQYQGQAYQTTNAAVLSASMADEFLERLRNGYPSGGFKDQTHVKQATLTSGPTHRACPPNDGKKK